MKKNLFLFAVAICIGFTGFSQTLEQKAKELATAEQAVKDAAAKVAGIQAEIAKLTPPVYWKKGGFAALNFNSLGLTNWAAGGVESNSLTAFGNIYRNYSKDKINWINNLDLAYGLLKNREAGQTFFEGYRKNEDKIDFLTKAGKQVTEKLSYAALVNFKSQFAPGFDFGSATYTDSSAPISRFLAPAFVLASVGMDYKVNDALSVYLSPATGKFTIVNDDSIAAQHAFIPNTLDENGVAFYSPNFRSEFGALLNAIYAKDLTKRINLRSTLNLFNNYTDINTDNRKNIDVDWQAMLNMKLNQYISASLFAQTIYDNDVAISIYDDAGTLTGSGPRTQFKRLLGVGFSYKF